MNVYYDPADAGLTLVGEIDWSDGSYQFDLTVVWRRQDGRFVYGEDSGCSCPTPFESETVEGLTVLPQVGGLEAFREHCAERQTHAYDGDRSADVVRLVEAMYAAGAR